MPAVMQSVFKNAEILKKKRYINSLAIIRKKVNVA